MQVILADEYGFCFGVKLVVNKLEDLIKKNKVYTYGELIHNKQFIEYMRNKGMEVINNLDDVKNVPKGSVILSRAHGILKSEKEEIKRICAMNGCTFIEGTCPYVTAVHVKANILKKNGYDLVLIGDKNHPEVKAALSYMEEPKIIEKPEDLDNVKLGKRVGIVTQTTQSIYNISKILEKILSIGNVDDIRILNTRCNATDRRQSSAKKLAKQVDVMVVIGGKHSANTKRLYELCSKIVDSYHIETKDDIDVNWFYKNGKKVDKVGVTAGASTPKWVIDEVVNFLKTL